MGLFIFSLAWSLLILINCSIFTRYLCVSQVISLALLSFSFSSILSLIVAYTYNFASEIYMVVVCCYSGPDYWPVDAVVWTPCFSIPIRTKNQRWTRIAIILFIFFDNYFLLVIQCFNLKWIFGLVLGICSWLNDTPGDANFLVFRFFWWI